MKHVFDTTSAWLTKTYQKEGKVTANALYAYQNPLGNVSPDNPNSTKNLVEGAYKVTEKN